MKNIFIIFSLLFYSNAFTQNIIGKWKCIATYSSFDNKKTNMISGLHQSRPCTKNTVFDFKADGKIVRIYSGCDTKYVEMQNKLWKKQQWKVEGSNLKTSVTDFSIFNEYIISFSSNKMTWTNNDETIIYQKL
ncbi:MAG TPA: lipocalin family protein [Chitinophagales bacterium]|nr:lipocalin family protein [Chitinophagales bacterium]